MPSDLVYVDGLGTTPVPNTQIQDAPYLVLRPCRGYSASLAAFDIDNKCIGWVAIQDLGFDNVRQWMEHTKYIIQG